MSEPESITGGFRGEPRSVNEWMRRELADPKTRTAVDREVKRLLAGPWQLRVSRWLGNHLPFRWAPRVINNALARWMWRWLNAEHALRGGGDGAP